MKGWSGGACGSTEWLSARWSDVYRQETACSRIRSRLYCEYTYSRTHAADQQFRVRLGKVAAHMNSNAFPAAGGRGLLGVCQSMRSRCAEVLRRNGERIPK